MTPELRVLDGHWAEIPAVTAYGLLRLRAAVFVVEQECAYQDLDGIDLRPGVTQLWIEHDDEPVAALRVIPVDGHWEVGRVVTHPEHRNRRLSSHLMREALGRCGRPVRIRAQSYLEAWYGGFGFVVDGDEFLEDGIPHLPMLLA